jgi:hypothetical protein
MIIFLLLNFESHPKNLKEAFLNDLLIILSKVINKIQILF